MHSVAFRLGRIKICVFVYFIGDCARVLYLKVDVKMKISIRLFYVDCFVFPGLLALLQMKRIAL